MHIGIDFGTTNSSVAHYDGSQLHSIELDPTNETPHVLPSLIYIDRQHDTKLGTAAATEYLAKETGRRISWERRDLSPIEIIVGGGGSGPIRYWHEVNIETDVGAHGRLLQSVKTALRDPRYEGTRIFDLYYTVDELIAMLLKGLKERAEAQLDSPCDSVVLGRPVRFSEDPSVNERAVDILYRAARFAGFREITFQMEPIAAAHLYHRQSKQREMAMVFDFGGGTLDLTVVEVGGARPPQVIATEGVLVGGDDLDRSIMKSLLPYFGKGCLVEDGAEFPADYLDLLHSWQTMPELSRPEPLSRIRRFQKTSSNPRAMRALETLVTRNVGYSLFHEIERTKKELTPSLMARLDFQHEAIDIHERILRRDFEEMIAPELGKVEASLDAVLTQAGVPAEDIDVVLRTGGTSLVPAFAEQLARRFGPQKVREMDPLTSVVGGMAIVAHDEAGVAPSWSYRYENPLTNVRATSGRVYEPTILRARTQCYTDRDYRLINLPLELSGLHALRSADLDYDSEADKLLRFALKRASRVYIIYQAKAQRLPFWLQGFKHEAALQVEIETPGGLYPFLVYSRDFPEGSFAIGGAHAKGYAGIVFLNYLMAVKPL